MRTEEEIKETLKDFTHYRDHYLGFGGFYADRIHDLEEDIQLLSWVLGYTYHKR